MAQMPERPAPPAGVTVFAVLGLFFSAVALVISILAILFIGSPNSSFGGTSALVDIQIILSISVIGFVISIGMLRGWKWVWYASIIMWVYFTLLGVFSLSSMIGFLNSSYICLPLSVIGLWYFLQQHVKTHFGTSPHRQKTK
jgi:hypothetical protein